MKLLVCILGSLVLPCVLLFAQTAVKRSDGPQPAAAGEPLRKPAPASTPPGPARVQDLPSTQTQAQAPTMKNPARHLIQQARPRVIAHRGYSSLAPENSMPAFRKAMAAGADLVELDYHHSKDGVPMVLHDDTLDRTTDAMQQWGGRGLKLRDYASKDLLQLQTGLWFDPPHARSPLPTLAQAVELIQSGSVTLIERKSGDAATCVALLRERGWTHQVVVQAFDWEYLRDYHRLEPDQVLGALGPPSSREGRKLTTAEKTLDSDWLKEISQLGAQLAVWNSLVDEAAVRAAHGMGLKVWIYTINDETAARRLLDMGVDGIISDNPAIIWKTLATR